MSLFSYIDKIPAHIRYPGMIVLLLFGSCSAQGMLASAAFSGRGPQVEDDYYAKGLKVEATQKAYNKSQARGWKVDVLPIGTNVMITVKNKQGQALSTPVKGNVILRRPHLAKFNHSVALEPASAPGTFTFVAPKAPAGLWDLEVVLQPNGSNDASPFVTKVRSEW